MGKKLENAVAILNGAVGDYLARSGNGLATEMAFFQDDKPLSLSSLPPRKRLVIFVHGLMNTETAWCFPDGSTFGEFLARDFGDVPLFLRYNSGLSIPENGAALSQLVESLLALCSPREIILIGYSMGGLVLRSACHTASLSHHQWLGLVQRAIYVGTPHLGAPMERVGRLVTRALKVIPNPYTRLISTLANLRSDGIKDLGDADLRHQDRDTARLSLLDARHPVPLLPQIRHLLIAGVLSDDPWLAALFGDAIVPLASGTNGVYRSTERTPSNVKIVPGVDHIDLPRCHEVYTHIQSWCTPGAI